MGHHIVCMLVVDLNIQDMMIPSWESQPSNPALVLFCKLLMLPMGIFRSQILQAGAPPVMWTLAYKP